VVGFVFAGVVDAAAGDSSGSSFEVDGSSVALLGPRLASEPVPLLDELVELEEEAPLGLSEPVPSA
jgi:hypothetical protein